MKPARIMIAQTQSAMAMTSQALGGYELVEVLNLQKAEYLLIEDGIELFVIGIHFDESRALNLVSIIKADMKHKTTPIILIRLTAAQFPALLKNTIEPLLKAGAVQDYLELEDDPAYRDRIRTSVENCLNSESVIN